MVGKICEKKRFLYIFRVLGIAGFGGEDGIFGGKWMRFVDFRSVLYVFLLFYFLVTMKNREKSYIFDF
jgi:hypothetical protein